MYEGGIFHKVFAFSLMVFGISFGGGQLFIFVFFGMLHLQYMVILIRRKVVIF
jgi:hypothetical protein